MWDSIKYSIKNILNFKGRANRTEYWLFQLFLIIYQFFNFFIALLFSSNSFTIILTIVWIFSTLIFFFLLFASFSLTIRRLHDVGLSAWYYTIGLSIAFVAVLFNTQNIDSQPFSFFSLILSIIIFIITLIPSQKGTNKYG